MAQSWARAFYSSTAWKRTREAYTAHAGGICERCERMGVYGVPGEIVHHKNKLTARNINDTQITLSFDNLELLCRDCHAAVHEVDVYGRQRRRRRYEVDARGHVKTREE